MTIADVALLAGGDNHFLVMDVNGAWRQSTAAGRRWQPIPAPFPGLAIALAGGGGNQSAYQGPPTRVGRFVTTNGTSWAFTENTGSTWIPCSTAPDHPGSDVVALAGGREGFVAVTHTPGAPGLTRWWNSIDTHLFVLGEQKAGRNWSEASTPPSFGGPSVLVAGGGGRFVASDGTSWSHSSDKGSAWTSAIVPPSLSTTDPAGIRLVGGAGSFLVTDYPSVTAPDTPSWWLTANGGVTWQPAALPPAFAPGLDLAIAGSDIGFMVSDGTTWLYSASGGNNWCIADTTLSLPPPLLAVGGSNMVVTNNSSWRYTRSQGRLWAVPVTLP